MHIVARQDSVAGPAQMFTGQVWFDQLVVGEAPSRVRMNSVHFAPGARTAWHSHAVGQTLHVLEGVGLVQARGGDIIVIRAGDTIWTRPASGTGTAPRPARS